ncbi:unnamed protein product [Caenorhabditis bovis]|uniref:Dystrophin n=1 Tax=Caenorhabditis bovis TaxID=2654633 RepID=A0A8S1F0K5_9PELO|nr:unnamed protein product [Caenorhabditis bovis]
MMFSGGMAAAKSKKDEKKEKKLEREEKYELQEQVFMRWANAILGTERLSDYRHLHDSSNAIFILQAITSQPMAVLGNASDDWPTILQFVGDTKTNPAEVIDGQQKAVLSAWWQLIQFFWKCNAPPQLKDEKLTEAIKRWCIEAMKAYDDIDVYDFTSSFRDGHAFNYLIHSYDKKLINLSKTADMSAIDRIEHAFGIAERELGVPRLLQPKDLHSEQLDSHSVICYLMSLYMSMITKSRQEETFEAQQQQQQQALLLQQQQLVQQTPALKMHSQPSTSTAAPAALSVPAQQPPQQQQSAQPSSHAPTLDRGKSMEQSVESEVRSRKSSSSSQKSGKTKKQRREEQMNEFKSCIEQVLTWLLEAEDELSTLTLQQRADLAAVRAQFADFEMFMSSLTDSQDTVGRVLLRGQMLSNKSDSDEEKEAIAAKLHLVNSRWEALREQAMHEQAALQMQINTLQQNELTAINQWLDSTELEIESFGPLASDSETAIRQIELHHKFQQKIDEFQETIDKLESFVAVVDEENDASVATLEDALSSVSARWQSVCEWAEKRATKLDGLADLIDRTNAVFAQLSNWLTNREQDIMGLKSAHHLEDEAQVAEQVKKLQAAESLLETEHSSFVQLSQLSCDLVSRLEESNQIAANNVRSSLYSITQRWDNLVARIEEYGKTLVKSGKADLMLLQKPSASTPTKVDEPPSSEGVSTDTEVDETKNLLVDKFLMHISKLSHELVPLQEWSENFTVSRKPDQVRRMMNTCQEKLIEIKEQEARVNRLQLELEHLHAAKLNSKQLKRANDAFENFAKGWARIVTKISEAMNVLTGHAHDGEEQAVAAKIEQWIAAVDKVIVELAHLPVPERRSRIDKLEAQLKVQDKNVNFIKKDLVRKAILKKGLEIANSRLNALRSEQPDEEKRVSFSDESAPQSPTDVEKSVLAELDGQWAAVGDVDAIQRDVVRAQNAVERARSANMSNEIVEKAETRRAEMEERQRVTIGFKTKVEAAESTIAEIESIVERLSTSDVEIADLVRGFEKEAEKLSGRASQRKEVERTGEKILSMEPGESVANATRRTVDTLNNRWQHLEKLIGEKLEKAKMNQEAFIQKRIREGEEALSEIKEAIEKKRESLDAEAAAENLDKLESSLDNISSLFGDIGTLPMDDATREKLEKLAKAKEAITSKATEALAALSRTVSECEDFEKQIMMFQNWSAKINFLLVARKSSDLTAFDIPHEFHDELVRDEELLPRLTREFDEWDTKLKEMDNLVHERNDAQRMQEQLAHAKDTMLELHRKFHEFKRPKGFEEKLEKLVSTLATVENSLDDTTGIEGSECGGALMEVRSQLRSIDAVVEDLRDLHDMREQLVKDKILDEDDARESLKKLQYAKTKSKELYERGSTCVERLEDCVEMFQRLKMESDEIERFLDNMEKRLDVYAASDSPEDESVVNELISEWNRNEAAMNNAAHLQRQLNERAVKLTDDILSLKRIRADALKTRLNSWSRTIQEMGDDDETALLEIDELHQTIEKGLNDVADKPPEQIAEKLRFLRADRDRLSSRTRKLAARNPRLAATSSNVLGELNAKWATLEQKSAAGATVDAPPRLPNTKIDEDAPFEKKVDELVAQFRDIAAFLDFDAAPVATVEAYKTRIDDLDLHLDEHRPPLDKVIEEGRGIAQRGRLELHTHAAIEKLDELANNIEDVENRLDVHRDKVGILWNQYEQLKNEIEALTLVLDVFADRNLDDVAIAQDTRRELAERDSAISSLTSRATAIHCQLPGRGPQLHDSTMDRLRDRIEKLETRLTKGVEKQSPEKEVTGSHKSSPSRSSMLLAMEAYATGTEEDSITSDTKDTVTEVQERIINLQEETSAPEVAEVSTTETIEGPSASEETERTVREVPVDIYEETANISSGDEMLNTSPIDVSNSNDGDVAKMFEDLDTIEDMQTNWEEFPFDYLEVADAELKSTLEKLDKCETILEKNEMQLNVIQSETARDRIAMLREMTKQKLEERLPKLRDEWDTLQKDIAVAEEAVCDLEQFETVSVPNMDKTNTPQILAELRQKVANAEKPVIDLVKKLSQIVPRMQDDSPKSHNVRKQVYDIEDRYRKAVNNEQEAVSRAMSNAMNEKELKGELDKINEWCDKAIKEVSQNVNSLDSDGLLKFNTSLDEFAKQLHDIKNELVRLEMAKNVLISTLKGDAQHDVRRHFSETAKRVAMVRDELSDARQWATNARESCDVFWKDVDKLEIASRDVARRANAIRTAVIYTPSKEGLHSCLRDIEGLKQTVADIKKRVQTANLPPAIKLAGKNAKRVVQVLTETAGVIADTHNLHTLISEMSESGGDTTESRSTVVEMTPTYSHAKQSSSSSEQAESVSTNGADGEHEEDEEDEEEEEERRIKSETATPRGSVQPENAIGIQLTHTRHWLHDVERDASLTVDLAEWQPTRELWKTVQGIIDEIRLRSVSVTGAHDASPNRQVRQQAASLLDEMRRIIEACERRCQTLNQIADDARQNEDGRTDMELWLRDANDIIGQRRVEEMSEDDVKHELASLEELVEQLDARKAKMQEINTQANKIVDTYTKDEAHNLSHLLSRLNMSWTKFNDNLRIRRAVLEASLRSRRDFHSALTDFEAWLARQEDNCTKLAIETTNTQAIKDTARRKQWTLGYKSLNAELTAHEDVRKSVESMGKLLVERLESGPEKADLQRRVSEMSQRWEAVRKTADEIGERLEKAEQEWEKLSDGLADLLAWIEDKCKKLVEQQPIGGSLSAVMQQSGFVKNLERDMEQKGALYKQIVSEAHSFLMQHDLRPKLHSPQVLDDDYDGDDLADLEQRRRGLEINANCEKLKKNWAELGADVEAWDKLVQHAMQRLQELERNLAECQLHLTSSENEIETMKAVEKIHLEDLKIAREETDQVSRRIDEVRLFIDDVNDAAARLLAEDLKLDEHARGQIEHVNKRYATLKRAIRIRQAAVRNAASDFGPTSEHFLNQSVNLPWQRAISKVNLLPYYIEQNSEKTQWEHPAWVEIMKELSQFNRVKFIAYRTAMKLRALQKRLCMDLVDLPLLEKAFVRLKGLSPEECPGLEGLVCALLPMFEALNAKYPNQVQSVSLAVDICINFLLNLFDASRDGIMRVLSFKIALIVFSNIPLDEKYKYLFKLVSQDGHATQKQVALLLYDLIHIPRLVGESAAFGGSNVEPSVRSCFETVRLAPTISEGAFLDWVKKEPQTIVWLAVMHRLIVSENTKHQSKCNVCKMFPIVGLRYRCLSCFNLDLCQNCFFSQRTAKRHKLKHPMQEYSGKTSSTDDARDFAKMIRNKLRSSRRQLAYLPIDVAQEGVPLTCPPAKVTNVATEQLNADTAAMAAHLAKLSHENPNADQIMEPVQSPLQIINQVEQMQRDEMDQLLHRLQIENQQLRKELEQKRGAASTMELDKTPSRRYHDRMSETRGGTLPLRNGRSVVSLKSTQSQNDVMDEAKALRLHKQRLEHRSRILEQQNEQLEMQLQRLKKVIDAQKQQTSATGTLRNTWTPERALSAGGSVSAGLEGRTNGNQEMIIMSNPNATTSDDEATPRGSSVAQMQNLMNACDDLGRAMESLVVSVVYDSDENED